MAATGTVEIVDFKGRYGLEVEDEEEIVAMFGRAIAAFPEALLEDGHELPELVALLERRGADLLRRADPLAADLARFRSRRSR